MAAKKKRTTKKRPAKKRPTKTSSKTPRTKSKRKPAKEKPTAPADDAPRCVLRTDTGLEIPVIAKAAVMQEIAMRWSYSVNNRRRWRRASGVQRDQQRRAGKDLARLAVGEKDLQQLAQASYIEVSVPFRRESERWEARVLPWEFVLSAATAHERVDRSLTIVRHLDRLGDDTAPPVQESTALVVTSSPGAFEDEFVFDTEREAVAAGLGEAVEWLPDPTIDELEAEMAALSPRVVHLSGIDAHQGAALLGQPGGVTDGLYLSGPDGEEQCVGAQRLARALTGHAAAGPPALVFFNCYNSAPRLAAMTVALGAGAAIGFQAEIDESLAERFAATFYTAWRLADGDALQAFDAALTRVRDDPAIRGSGVVLWSAESLLPAASWIADRRRPRRERTQDMAARMKEEVGRPILVEMEPAISMREALARVLKVVVKPKPRLNYSLLHNDGDIFDTFDLTVLRTGTLRGVEVSATLHVGADAFPFRATFDRDNLSGGITKDVRVPLTWGFVRSLRESIRTTLYVRVARDDAVIYEQTHVVTLDPVEEWIDNERNAIWLPSFVLPRDPAVATVIDRAQRFLCALMDDPGAGFDGYQSYDEHAEDPAEAIDLQVRAIWWALIHGSDIAYINPPPSYSESSQRLRKPTDVVENGRGTCIDLALLLCACLEYVEIYPVMLLLKGHAFPGYWRSLPSYDRFLEAAAADSGGPAGSRGGAGVASPADWMISSAAYQEIVTLVNDDDLVPLESVRITDKAPFQTAFADGIENLSKPEEFDWLVDISIARENDVTPLPL